MLIGSDQHCVNVKKNSFRCEGHFFIGFVRIILLKCLVRFTDFQVSNLKAIQSWNPFNIEHPT